MILLRACHTTDLDCLERSFATETDKYDSFEFTVEGEVAAYLGIKVSYKAKGAIHLKQPFLIKWICKALEVFEDQQRHDPLLQIQMPAC